MVAAVVAAVAGAVVLGFNFNRLDGVPRSLPVLQVLLMGAALIGIRILARVWHDAREYVRLPESSRPFYGETVLVIGSDALTDLYLRSVSRIAPDRVRVAGLLSNDPRHVGRSILRCPILGTPEELPEILRILEVHGVFVDRIVVAMPSDAFSPATQQTLSELEGAIAFDYLHDDARFAPLATGESGRSSQRSEARCEPPLLLVSDDDISSLGNRSYWRVKRAMDCIAALILLIILAPLFAIVAALVAFDVGSPVIFWQQRPGLNGRPFKLYKFRTMAPAHDASGRRLRDEDRSSWIGRFLRRTRLDELPQLVNIFVGEMSFVGPRPLLPIDQPADYSARTCVRPGLTGWAQIKGGREISAADKGALDVWYVRNASFALDVEVILSTISIVIFGETIDMAAIQHARRDLKRAEAGASRCEPVSSFSREKAETA